MKPLPSKAQWLLSLVSMPAHWSMTNDMGTGGSPTGFVMIVTGPSAAWRPEPVRWEGMGIGLLTPRRGKSRDAKVLEG
jgi:hypothetical protein